MSIENIRILARNLRNKKRDEALNDIRDLPPVGHGEEGAEDHIRQDEDGDLGQQSDGKIIPG
jgi:hypothetical protein